jgi:drug/metabolite transporter (DMT)-like permease
VEAETVSAILAALAAIFFALAATLWQRATLSLEEVSIRRPKSFLVLLLNLVWLAGLVAQGAAVVLQGAALDRGPLALVQPLLVTTIVFALPLGYFLTEQDVTVRQVLGALVIVAGLALFGVYGNPAEGTNNVANTEWFATFVFLGGLCWALTLFADRGGATAKAAVYGTVAGITYGVSATLMNSVVESLHTEGWDVLTDWQLYALAATGVGGFLVQQLSLSTGQLAASVATVSVTNPVVSVVLGVILFGEALDNDPTWHRVIAVAGLSLALVGTAIISSAREREHEEVAEGAAAPTPA